MEPYDRSHEEIESREELDRHLARGRLSGLVVQGLPLDDDPPDFSAVEVDNTLFIACRFVGNEVESDLIRRGAQVIPDFHEELYPTHPFRLYAAEDLAAGFTEAGFHEMYDTRVHRHFVTHGGALPGLREALAQRMHDHGIDDALGDTIDAWTDAAGGPVVGVMGGHAEPRGDPGYRVAARIGWRLAVAGCLVVTGGGPGVMEAANLGAALSTVDQSELDRVVDRLAVAPYFTDPEPYTKVALDVLAGLPKEKPAPPASAEAALTWARHGGLSVPTWLYGHEPANLFAARIAKYFSNAIREDTILRLARGGVVFAAGRAGTVQEVFQAATKMFYATDGASGPLIFVNTKFWTEVLPVERLLRPLLTDSPHGDLSPSVHLTDDVDEAVTLLLKYGPPAAAKEAQRTTP